MDYCELDGARTLARSIEAYWQAKGHSSVTALVERVEMAPGNGRTIYAIRSNLRNGLPPK